MDEFHDLNLWSNIAPGELDVQTYCFTDLPKSSARSSVSSQAEGSIESPKQCLCYTPAVSHAGNVPSPQDSRGEYQLPSPLEDESILLPGLADKQRRREQNRVAQRAFRERKESKLKQLENKIASLKADQRKMEKKYDDLRTAHLRLQSGLKILLDAGRTLDDTEADSESIDTSHTE